MATRSFKTKSLASMLALSIFAPALPHVIVFDVGEVLLTTNTFQSFLQLGVKDTLCYSIKEGNNISSKLRAKLFDVLLKIKPFEKNKVYTTKDEHGVTLPPLMLDWLSGANPELIRTEVIKQIRRHPTFFKNSHEMALIEQLVNLMFTPGTFIKTRTPNKPIVKILARLAEKKKHTILICSNWDAYSFADCQKAFPEIFQHINGCIVSGFENCMKPDALIFERLNKLITEKKAGTTCSFFIDDQAENRTAAKKHGFIALHPNELESYCKRYKLYT